MKIILIASILCLLCIGVANAATKTMCASGCDYTNLQAAFAGMSGGDTLTISDGTYTGSTNVINASHLPPAGPGTGTGDARFTVIKAANPGMVIIGNNSADVFDVSNNEAGNVTTKWLKFEGMIFKGNYVGFWLISGTSWPAGAVPTNNRLHWYLKGCGFNETNGSWQGTIEVDYAGDILFEDCFTWGRARYGACIMASDYVIMRRHLDRRDAVQANASACPSASYMNYASHYVEWQNIITMDVDGLGWDGIAGGYGNIYIRNSNLSRTSDHTSLKGAMVINDTVPSTSCGGGVPIAGLFAQQDPTNTTIYNMLMWKTDAGIHMYNGPSATVSHVTIGPRYSATTPNDYWGYAIGAGSGVNVSNSNCYNTSLSLTTMSGSSTYNNDYSCGGSFSGSNITTTNTAYQYTFKPEATFPDGNDSQKKGAKILYKYGVDGTFYSETGYADAQTEVAANKLWPWGRAYTGDNSWEKRIWALMRADSNPSTETRGFAGASQSITNWIATGAGSLTPTHALTIDGAGGTSLTDVDTYIYEGEAAPSVPTIIGVTISGGSLQ
jgi:hypothetical protein